MSKKFWWIVGYVGIVIVVLMVMSGSRGLSFQNPMSTAFAQWDQYCQKNGLGFAVETTTPADVNTIIMLCQK